jgi:hypothetical protein
VYIMNGIRVNVNQDLAYGSNIKQYKFQYLTIYVLSLSKIMLNSDELNNFVQKFNVYFTMQLQHIISNQKSVFQAMKCLTVIGHIWKLYFRKSKVYLVFHYLMGLLHVIKVSRGAS